MRATVIVRLLPLVVVLAVSVGLLATFTHSPDHVNAGGPAITSPAVDRHHCGATTLVVQAADSVADSLGAASREPAADDAAGHSNIASCLAALLVVIGGLMAGFRLLALPASWWMSRRAACARVQLRPISAMLCAPSALRLSRLLI